MIKVFPSRHPINIYPGTGQPLESHPVHFSITLADWLQRNVKNFDLAKPQHPISIDVNGLTIDPAEWGQCSVTPADDVRIYPVPRGLEAATLMWISIAVLAVAVVYTLSAMPDAMGGQEAGNQLNTSTAKANSVRLYEPIREVLGRDKVYPDYLVQPVTRFYGPRDVRTQLFLSVGVGEFSLPASGKKIGSTPFSAFGEDLQHVVYPPGADVSADPRSENWYLSPEVGSSKSATAGLDLGSPVEYSASSASALVLNNRTITLLGSDAAINSSWIVGTVIKLQTPNDYLVDEAGAYSTIAGQLNDLAPYVGMPISLVTPTEDLELVVASYTPGAAAVPSSVLASAPPTTLDFSTAVTWSISFDGETRSLTLDENYTSFGSLVSAVDSQLSGMGLTAQSKFGNLQIIETSDPFLCLPISQSGEPPSVFGSPTYTTGMPEQPALLTLKYENNAPFKGLPIGKQRLALGYRGDQFVITDIDDLTVSLNRLNSTGVVDTGWPGFANRTLLDFSLNAKATLTDNWIGPFVVCPEGEVVDRIEWDMFFPQGLIHVDKKGRDVEYRAIVRVEWANVETGVWTGVTKTYKGMTRDAFGVTEFLDFPTPIRPMIRMRSIEYNDWSNSMDKAQWLGLRGRLLERPTAYNDITSIAITVRTGDRLSAMSDRKVSVEAIKIYEEGANQSIYGAWRYICESAGLTLPELDIETVQYLQSQYYTPRGETFDYSFTKQVAVKDALQMVLGAGMSTPVLDDGLVSAVREGVQTPRGMLTPHDQESELKISFSAPGPDDYSGVDVKYVDPVTFTEEIVECRLPGLIALKVETYTLDGVKSRTRAWRIGMRRLMKYRLQRLTANTKTEMDALAYRYLDLIIMSNDIPGDQNISCLVEAIDISGGTAVITVSEPLDWTFPAPRCYIRRQDGSLTSLLIPTEIDDYRLSLPAENIDWKTDWSIEPPRLLFCSSSSVGYPMLIESIEPDENRRCSVKGLNYTPDLYKYDDSQPD
jgi:hypothetical protein